MVEESCSSSDCSVWWWKPWQRTWLKECSQLWPSPLVSDVPPDTRGSHHSQAKVIYHQLYSSVGYEREIGPSSCCSHGQIHCLDPTSPWKITCLARNKWAWTRTRHFSCSYLRCDEIHPTHTQVVMILEKCGLCFPKVSAGQPHWPHAELPVLLWDPALHLRCPALTSAAHTGYVALSLLLSLCTTHHYSKSLCFFSSQTVCPPTFMRSFGHTETECKCSLWTCN